MLLTTHLTESTEEAAAFIKQGQLVAFPTETVYGLGGNALSESSVENIYRAKERPIDNPLIVHIHSLEQINTLVKAITPPAKKLIDAFFPGPITLILERAEHVPKIVSAGLSSIAIRMPANDTALRFLQACDLPVAAPSANRSGRPSPTTWQDVYTDLKGRISCILKGEQSQVGLESTVIDCRYDQPRILRAGGIPVEKIQEITSLSVVSNGQLEGEHSSPSPGVKHKHYAPKAIVHIVNSPDEVDPSFTSAFIGLNPYPFPEKLGLYQKCLDLTDYAYQLFHFFRRCDRAGISDIYCESTSRKQLGNALMDRITRASER
ncbi:MAG: threonylcarbamoyl-AMP synthase [Rhodothermaceae bacterium]|nr:threonylcarbamoyl-AMP synthase [Rhodothermaceae bacterium]